MVGTVVDGVACRPVVGAAIVFKSPALGGVSLKIALPREAADGSSKGGEGVVDRETDIVLRTDEADVYVILRGGRQPIDGGCGARDVHHGAGARLKTAGTVFKAVVGIISAPFQGDRCMFDVERIYRRVEGTGAYPQTDVVDGGRRRVATGVVVCPEKDKFVNAICRDVERFCYVLPVLLIAKAAPSVNRYSRYRDLAPTRSVARFEKGGGRHHGHAHEVAVVAVAPPVIFYNI